MIQQYAPEKIEDAEQSAGSKSIAFAFVIVILLMTFIFSELDNIVTLVHAEGGADIGQCQDFSWRSAV